MRITKLELKNFKRFTDLTIDGIPEEAKLVLLIGSNGSGKSSVFDAFDYVVKQFRDDAYSPIPLENYYAKNNLKPEVSINFSDGNSISIVDKSRRSSDSSRNKISKFTGRSSIRIVPRVTNQVNLDFARNNTDGPLTFIDADERFTSDVNLYIQEIDNALRAPVFRGESADTLKIFQDYIDPLNTSLINILGGDTTTTIQIAAFQNPTAQSSGQLIFQKGESRISYDLLSHGEKQVVILLLNFIVRKPFYEDAIIFIDEMDCHLNTSLQVRLLNEITNGWVPENSQLWTASHALGFIDFARNAENAALIDLDLLNFDIPQIILPEPKDKMEVYEVALPKEIIKNVLKGYRLVTVENQNDQHYNLALGEDGFLFLPAQNSREVFMTIKEDPNKLGLRDRDYLTDEEIVSIQKRFPNLKILKYYAFENYIYHPDNIAELNWIGFDKAAYIQEIVDQKNKKLIPIVADIQVARQSYPELKEEGVKKSKSIDTITEGLQSNDLETFYPFYSIKSHYNKAYLQKFSYFIKDLVKTQWFKEKIEEILKNQEHT
ncbi:AAA15 family ATPase/GTPase [Chitinophaga niastensis]|uniref:AAA15 family ATPase/GTPase n=1 Tax=Chitinophaga niastensis TaxID=536980 RepID=A0A2P8HGW3_CHINA|nr:AAA family ATPase [Chitinophaga niastensis]PSL45453.1 AAA15 family ATPase/GTPase [Chitinophaga niastensis]